MSRDVNGLGVQLCPPKAEVARSSRAGSTTFRAKGRITRPDYPGFRAATFALAALAIALAGSLAVAAKIADHDCARLAGPGPWASAPAWIADGLTDIRAQAYARCVGEAR